MNDVLNELCDTQVYSIVKQVESIYQKIQITQAEWYGKSQFYCPEGCGECCRNFEPNLLECEAIFMAVWLLQNQKDIALKVMNGDFPFIKNNGCPFWDENSPYHCTIYEGRGFICRLFGASGFRSKQGSTVWKPCKFYPSDLLSKQKIPLSHRQYSQEELKLIFGITPPVMSDLMELSLSFNPGTQKTELIIDILPKEVRKLQWIISMNNKENYTES